MIERGYEPNFAERCFKQIEGFGDYGFPESHAASFALLVYVSSWLKCYHPAIFACALLNSQPMGFYAPAQIVRDAREHRVTIRPVDVNHSEWDCTLEANQESSPALRLGFNQIKGLRSIVADTLLKARRAGNARPFSSPEDLWLRSNLKPTELKRLAKADAYGSAGLSRRQALWEVRRINPSELPLFSETGENIVEPEVSLPVMTLGEEVSHDYATIQLSLKRHPLELLRKRLSEEGALPTRQLTETKSGKLVTVAGLVITRQRPSTASGVIFATLEDETGIANVIIWPKLFERYRRETLASSLLCVTGELQREGLVIHVIAKRLIDMSDRLTALMEAPQPSKTKVVPADKSTMLDKRRQSMYPSRDFH